METDAINDSSPGAVENGIPCELPEKNLSIAKTVFLLCTLPALFGNLLIILAVVRFKCMRNTFTKVVCNLAVSDIIVTLMIPFHFTNNINMAYPVRKYSCILKNAIFAISVCGSATNLLIISAERWVAVKFPLKRRRWITKRRLCATITVGWIFVVAVGCLPLLGWNAIPPKATFSECYQGVLWTRDYSIVLFSVLLVAITINGVLYASVLFMVLTKGSFIGRSRHRVAGRRDWRATCKTVQVVVVFVIFLVCWIPFFVVACVRMVDDTLIATCIETITRGVGLMSSGLNWIVYGTLDVKFRTAFRAILTCKKLHRGSSAQASITDIHLHVNTIT